MRTATGIVLVFTGLLAMVVSATHLLLPSSRLNRVVSTLPGVAHGLAFPLVSGVAMMVLGLLLLTGAVRRLHGQRGGRSLFVASVACGVSGVLLALSATGFGLRVPTPAEPRDDSFVMVSWNALDHFDGDSARQIFGDLRADVAVLPELEERAGEETSRIEQALTEGGLEADDYDIFESPPTGTHIAPLVVIVRKGFGGYTVVAEEQVTFGTLRLRPPSGSGLPEILALHTAPPVPRWMPIWSADLRAVRELAGVGSGDTIVVGDLNATLRHGGMASLTRHGDALLSAPLLRRGTWPTSAPPSLRSSIDHILVPVNRYGVVDARVVDIAGSDHAAVVATLTPGA